MDLREFLKSKFDKQSFIKFITDRFYGFALNLQSDEYLGKVKLDDKSEIGFFIFEVNEDKDIQNSRVGFHAQLKTYAKDFSLDGAIGAFYHPNQNAWRLSFIGFSYDDKDKQEVTNQKRFTFLLGINAINTPLNQFSLKDKNFKYSQISQIQEQFDIEKVSKEFFDEYRTLFEKLNAQLVPQIAIFQNEHTLHAFSKKLLGRIVFLYFLQKKGWLGVPKNQSWGDGDRDFLSKLYKNEPNDFYFSKLLPLFFDTLNKKRDDDYSTIFNSKIPFLNGGLFDKTALDEQVLLDDEVFEEIFTMFDRYNFTIIEDSPDESEIAIDPEMLGRVFENLLEENYRKGKGAFYTPREIVSYMCKSSLEHYLEEKTKQHKVLFDTDEFLNFSTLDDEKIKDFYLKHPQKYLVLNNHFTHIKPYTNLVVHFRIVAKLRGLYKDSKRDELAKHTKGVHSEITQDIWFKILKKEYIYRGHIIGSNKEIRLDDKTFIFPTIMKYVEIDSSIYALGLSPNIFGDLELNTIFKIRERDIKSRAKKQEKIINSWDTDRFAFDLKVKEELKSLWRDCFSPHTVLDYQNKQEHNTAADKFSEISHKLFKFENITDGDLRKHLSLKWYDLAVNKILNNSTIPQKDLRELMLLLIKQIKVLDPAIGSGAFPMGMLHEIVQTRIHLGDTTPYAKLKREIIENSIYGIDIDLDAVEIAKLRFWLSLTVDETIPSPLPNLDFKIMQGNSLVETINGFSPIPQNIYDKKEQKPLSLFDMAEPNLFDENTFDILTQKIHSFYNDSNGVISFK